MSLLAAPQVGVDLAVFVYDCLDSFGRRRQGLVCNAQIALVASPRMSTELERCLSLPGAYLGTAVYATGGGGLEHDDLGETVERAT
jgi:peptide deformylase